MIDVVAAVIEANNEDKLWTIRARVITVDAKVHAEHALIGLHITLTYSNPLHFALKLREGMLFRVGLPVDKAEKLLDSIAENVPLDSLSLNFEPIIISPMQEPSARVPLSVLRELRGQESVTERVRQAIVHLWSVDRRTGKAQKLDET